MVLIPFPSRLARARGFTSAAGTLRCSQVGGQGPAFPSPSHGVRLSLHRLGAACEQEWETAFPLSLMCFE